MGFVDTSEPVQVSTPSGVPRFGTRSLCPNTAPVPEETTNEIFVLFPPAGDYSLEMNPIMLDDDARYQCQVSAGPQGQRGIRSRFATVTVLVPPEPPKIIQGESLVTTEDREIELECISMAGKPAAEVRIPGCTHDRQQEERPITRETIQWLIEIEFQSCDLILQTRETLLRSPVDSRGSFVFSLTPTPVHPNEVHTKW